MHTWYSSLAVVALAACTPSTDGSVDAQSRVVADGVSSVVGLAPAELVATDIDGLVRLDPLMNERELLDISLAPVTAAALLPGRVVVSTEQQLLSGAEFLVPSPLTPLLPGPVVDLVSSGTDLWLLSEGRWWLHQNGELIAPTVGGQPLTGQLVAGRLEGAPVVWAQVGEGLVALAPSVDGPVVAARTGLVPVEFAATDGGLYASDEKRLWWFDGSEWTVLWNEPASAMCGNSGSRGVWANTEAGTVLLHDGMVLDAEVPAGTWSGCDEIGRLLTFDGEAVSRTAGAPGARIAGIERGTVLEDTALAVLDVTHVDTLEGLVVTVDGEAVAVQEDEEGRRTVVLDPAALSPEVHSLEVTASWSTGDTFSAVPLQFRSRVTGPISWSSHVQPLYDGRCSFCHDNGTETLLGTKELWIEEIDSILTEVIEARMPLGGDALTSGEIAMLQAWRDGGFQ